MSKRIPVWPKRSKLMLLSDLDPRMDPALVRTFIGPYGPWVNDAGEQAFGNPDATGPDEREKE